MEVFNGMIESIAFAKFILMNSDVSVTVVENKRNGLLTLDYLVPCEKLDGEVCNVNVCPSQHISAVERANQLFENVNCS